MSIFLLFLHQDYYDKIEASGTRAYHCRGSNPSVCWLPQVDRCGDAASVVSIILSTSKLDNRTLTNLVVVCFFIVFRLVPVEYVLQMVAAHCKSLTCLDYTCANSQNAVLTEAAEAILHAFVGSCTEVTSLVLCGVNLSDFKIQIILEGFKKLQSLDLSHSRGFTGTCFV